MNVWRRSGGCNGQSGNVEKNIFQWITEIRRDIRVSTFSQTMPRELWGNTMWHQTAETHLKSDGQRG